MSLQLILGSSGAGKSYYIYNRIIQESIEYPLKKYLVVVPEQFTMQTQKELVSLHPRKGILNIDILSFERLAYRILDEVGERLGQVLEETGKSLVLRRVAQEKQEQLQLLGTKLKKPGYIAQMKSTVSELTQYDISAGELDELIALSEKKPQLYYKLQDIQIVYQGFLDYLEGKYVTGEEILDILCRVVDKSEMIKDSVLVLDCFTGFTPIQNKLIRELLQLCKQVYVTLTISEEEKQKTMQLYQAGSPHQIFYLSRRTIQGLCKLAQETDTGIEEPLWIDSKGKGRFSNRASLAFLESHLFRYKKEVFVKEQEEIAVCLCKNPQSEIKKAARTILKLVREKRYRYKDFAVITGDLETYGNYVKKVFSFVGIPYFLDEKHSVLMNPFVEYLRSIVEMIVQNYTYESVFRFLRCGFSPLTQKETDRLENYVIALGIRGKKRWQQEWVRHYKGQEPEEVAVINKIRKQFIEPLMPLTKTLKTAKVTVKEKIEALYAYIVQNEIQMKLAKWEEYFLNRKEQALAKEYSQIYEIIMNLFDKMVDVLGEQIVTGREFQELLEAGLEEAKVAIIPPVSDQVVIGDMERTRLKDIKALFFVGVNEGMLPKEKAGSGFFTDMDREYLKQSEIELAPTVKENIYIQRFYLYLNLTKPSHALYLSYSKTNAKGEATGPAYLIHTMKNLFPLLTIEDTEEEKDLLMQIECPSDGLSYLAEGLREAVNKEPDNQWKELFTWYHKREEYRDKLGDLVDAAFFTNPRDEIGRSVARALYGSVLENSATRLEKFAACAFAHFLEYGLKIRERAQYEFNAVDLGNIVHTALETFSHKLIERGLTWESLTEGLRSELVEKSVEDIIHDYGNTILHSSARNEYMIARVKRMINRTVWALQQQIARGEFSPSRFEVSFAMADSLKSVNIALSDEESMKLRGRIDRVDVCEEGDKVYVKVVDYKSGNTSFDLVALYYGLQLQLVVYLNAALELEKRSHPEKEVEPAGIFYYNVKDPVVDKVAGESQEELNERLLKQLRVNGLVPEDSQILQKLDNSLEEGAGASNVIPVSYNKDGSLSKSSSAVSKEQFTVLSNYVNRKIKEIGQDILQGKAEASPYELGKKNACTYCPHRSVCGFDEKIAGYSYRRLKKPGQEEIWEHMKEEE